MLFFCCRRGFVAPVFSCCPADSLLSIFFLPEQVLPLCRSLVAAQVSSFRCSLVDEQFPSFNVPSLPRRSSRLAILLLPRRFPRFGIVLKPSRFLRFDVFLLSSRSSLCCSLVAEYVPLLRGSLGFRAGLIALLLLCCSADFLISVFSCCRAGSLVSVFLRGVPFALLFSFLRVNPTTYAGPPFLCRRLSRPLSKPPWSPGRLPPGGGTSRR